MPPEDPNLLVDFVPDSPAFYDDRADALFAHLRREDPVHWYEPGGFWCLTRQAEIREVSHQPKVFSSTRGLQMWQIPVQRAGEEVAPAAADGASGASILEMDPPEHIRHRRLVTSAFTPRYLQRLEDRIREITTETLDACDPATEVDFVEQIAMPLPMLVIAEMIGVPGGDQATFRRWSDSIIEAGGGGMTDEAVQDLTDLYVYFATSLAEHRDSPCDDLITLLLDAELDGEHLAEGEILMFLMTLLVAGNETTRNLISGGALALAQHPDQRAWLAADRERIPNAVDEMLRWVTPTRSFVRYAVSDALVGETTIEAGQHLVMFYGAANRDEQVFGETADRFDVTRDDAHRHLAFGFGEHLCLGAHLARLEARIMFEELLRRWPDWQVTGDPVRLESCLINGLVHLPVQLA